MTFKQISLISMTGCLLLLSGCQQESNTQELTIMKSRIASLEQQVAMLNQYVSKLEQESEQRKRILEQYVSDSDESVTNESTSSAANADDDNQMVSSASPTPVGIQKALQNAGFYHGSIDGKLGPKTVQAIKEFQSENDLVVDGKVGKNTWTKLQTYL